VIRQTLRTLFQGAATGPAPPDAGFEADVQALAERLDATARRRLGRSLALLHVDGGGCGGCALELRALEGLAYDLARYGLSFVSHPGAADVLLLTGPVTRAMQGAVLAAWQAMADPRWVVAVGDCAAGGGPFQASYAIQPDPILPLDLVIPGCPPAPAQVLAGLRALVEANAGQAGASPPA
jgi:Ni,Fe-hydrogenase III small subunit